MAVPNIIVSLSGSSFPIPQVGSTPWGQNVTNWIVAASGANGFVQIGGGSQPLLADLNFGANFGLISIYFKSRSANIAAAGVLRLAHGDTQNWRNLANTADDVQSANANDDLTWLNGTTGVTTVLTGNPAACYTASAAIAWTVALGTITGFNTLVYDTDSAFVPGTGIYTVPSGKGGLYYVYASVVATTGLATTIIALTITATGSSPSAFASAGNMNATNAQGLTVSGVFNMTAGGTIKIQQNSGVANAGIANSTLNYLIIKRIP